MNYFWANVGDKYKYHIQENAFWARKRSSGPNKKTLKTWENVDRIKKGDVIFVQKSYHIRAVAVAKGDGCDTLGPLDPKVKRTQGWGVEVEIQELPVPWKHSDFMDAVMEQYEADFYPPLTNNSLGLTHDYMLSMPRQLGFLVLDELDNKSRRWIASLIGDEVLNEGDLSDQAEEDIQQDGSIVETEKQQLVKSRRGQGIFRSRLEAIEPFCRITNVEQKRHLIASHIKPWSKSDNIERLDGNNGLLLAPHIDHLFDKGYISFEDNGDLIISKHIQKGLLASWSVKVGNYGDFKTEQKFYLDYHRNEVFEKFLK